MGMNNIYYRFLHLVEDPEYAQMPARLRMNVIGNPGIDKLDFELLSLAVSAVNGCGMCIVAHEKQLRKHEVSREAIQSAVRIAATVHAVAGVLEHAAAQARLRLRPPQRPERREWLEGRSIARADERAGLGDDRVALASSRARPC